MVEEGFGLRTALNLIDQLNKIYCRNSSRDIIHISWNVYNCIYFEEEIDDKRYNLVGGNWYSVDPAYVNDINKELQDINNYRGCCNFIKPKLSDFSVKKYLSAYKIITYGKTEAGLSFMNWRQACLKKDKYATWQV